jgi:hypothetical protein
MGHKNWMLVEGRNDQYVLRGLLQHHHIECAIPGRDKGYGKEAIVIDQRGGIQGVLEALEIVLDDGDLERLAVILDADTSIAARWDALCDIFARFGAKDVPRLPSSDGTVITLTQLYRTLRVGVWLMPDNQTTPGILENFVSFLIPDDDASLWQYAKDCVNKIPAQRHFSEVNVPKAEIHTWLAWQQEPGQPLGIAITARYLNADAPYALKLIDWVEQVFDLS